MSGRQAVAIVKKNFRQGGGGGAHSSDSAGRSAGVGCRKRPRPRRRPPAQRRMNRPRPQRVETRDAKKIARRSAPAPSLLARLVRRAVAALKPAPELSGRLVFESVEPRVLLSGDAVVPRVDGRIDVPGEVDQYNLHAAERRPRRLRFADADQRPPLEPGRPCRQRRRGAQLPADRQRRRRRAAVARPEGRRLHAVDRRRRRRHRRLHAHVPPARLSPRRSRSRATSLSPTR